jgi:hypothetical protein
MRGGIIVCIFIEIGVRGHIPKSVKDRLLSYSGLGSLQAIGQVLGK